MGETKKKKKNQKNIVTSGSDNVLGGKRKPHWLVGCGTDLEGDVPEQLGKLSQRR